jgi:3-dehydro-L-gulonate 2-dehydrogenase
MHRLPFDEVHSYLTAALIKLGFTEARASLSARLFAEATRDGVYSHGVNRFPRFLATIRNGNVDPAAEPRVVTHFGAMERWDGQRGPGNLNAYAAMDRALALSRNHGIACVTLGNTNHWMRGGTYGWQAADAGAIGICFTNTMPNLPPWGGVDPVIGNNPLVLAVPRPAGHVVLDIAMSQFSYGGIEGYRKRGEMLPVDGGFDRAGRLTRDPAAIEASGRFLPIGYWKGSGLAILLDVIASTLALGNATHQIVSDPVRETGLSQVFIAIQLAALSDPGTTEQIANNIIDSVHRCRPAEPANPVRYPGENTLRLRDENTRLGLPIDPAVWQEITAASS